MWLVGVANQVSAGEEERVITDRFVEVVGRGGRFWWSTSGGTLRELPALTVVAWEDLCEEAMRWLSGGADGQGLFLNGFAMWLRGVDVDGVCFFSVGGCRRLCK